jgi:hypothetical protein
MRAIRSTYLIIVIVLISVLAEISLALSSADYHSLESHVAVAHSLIVLNALTAVVGLRTPHRVAWIAYLVVSIALTVLIGAVTPLSVLGILARLYAPT